MTLRLPHRRSLSDEQIEAADKDSFFQLKDGVRVGIGRKHLAGRLKIITADGKEECLIEFCAIHKEWIVHANEL